jgi:adenylate kinase
MAKRVILLTGTPCVGKSSAAKLLASKLDALCVNLTELAVKENLTLGKDEERNTVIIDETRMKERISKIIENTEKENIVIDGHYASAVVPKETVARVFVLRRDPVELREFMKHCGFSERKLSENLASEILDVCLVDTLNLQEPGKTCEVNVTGKTVEETVREMLDILDGRAQCHVGIVDWLGKLENEGLLEEFLGS